MKTTFSLLIGIFLGVAISNAAIDSFAAVNGTTVPNTPPALDSSFGTLELALNLGNSSGGTLAYDGISFTNNNVTSATNAITWATVNGISVGGTGAAGAIWQNATNIVSGSPGPSGIYSSLFGTESWSNGTGINQTIGITGLDAGKSYQIQLLHGEDRSSGNGFDYVGTLVATDSASNTANVGFRFGDENDADTYVFGVVTLKVSGVTGVNILYPQKGAGGAGSTRDPSLAGVVIHSISTTVPTLTTLSPANGSSAVALASDFVITFSENIQKGAGNITIVSDDGNPANDGIIAVTSAEVGISGNTVTINPTANLAANTDYRIEIGAGAFRSTGGTNFPGISGNIWSFTTRVPPTLVGELGLLDIANANGGSNPATAQPWAAGDIYRLAFVTSGTRNATSPAIADYDAFVQSAASAVGWGAVTWKCVGQSANNPDAQINTGTSGSGGAGIFLVDGITKIADDSTDLWNGSIDNKWNRTETGGTYEGSVATGASRKFGDSAQPNIEHGNSGQTVGQWWQVFNGAQTSQWHFYALSEELSVLDSQDLADPSLIVADPSVLQPVVVGAGPVTRSVMITNGGDTETLNLTGVSFGGTAGTQFTAPTFPASLAPGASGTIHFTFTPGTPGLATATMTIASNAERSPSTTVALRVETLTNLVAGITYQAWQANRPLTAMPTLVNDQTPNIDELRTSVDYKDGDKDGVADGGAAYGFGTMPPLNRLENLYCEVSGVVNIATSGNYEFRLTADDGARLEINGSLEIDNSTGVRSAPVAAESGLVPLITGFHDIRITFWSGAGSPCLKLEWKRPGSGIWESIGTQNEATGTDGFLTDDYTRVVSAGDKAVYFPEQGQSSGELGGLHPGYNLFTFAGDFGAAGGDPSLNPPDILIEGTSTPYRPQTGGIGFLADGTLLQTNFTPYNYAKDVPPPDDATANDKIYAVSGATGNDISTMTVRVVADGLNSPMGVVEVGGDLYVAEVFKITRLRDLNDDGDYLDPEDAEEVIAPIVADNFHNWTFGMIHQAGWLHCTLSADIGGTDALGSNGYAPATRGNWFRVCIDPAQAPVGTIEQLAGGLRTPNGLGIGPEGRMFGTDNQGSWNPDNSLYELTPGHFYGHYNLWFQSGTTDPLSNPQGVAATGLADPTRQPSAFWDASLYWGAGATPIYAKPFHGGTRRFTRPAVYLQQNSMCNSPTDPLLIGDQHPTFKGQMFVGEHTRGGIRRVFVEKINGRFQGCVMRFTQGLPIGVNRMRWGPDGGLYFGGIGATRGWQWRNTTFGLGRLKSNGNDAFEIRTMRAVTNGFIITMTKPVTPGTLANTGHYLPVATASYPNPSYNYGAGKVDGPSLTVTQAVELPDGRSVRLTIPGLTADTTVHLRMNDQVVSATGEPLWSGEAFYTLNELPNDFESSWADWITTHFPGSADLEVIAPGADPDLDGNNNLAEFFARTLPLVTSPRDAIRISGNIAALTLVSREPTTIVAPLEVRWETSGNLATWTDVTADVVLENESPADAGFVERSYRLNPAGDPDRLFIRRLLVAPQ